MRDKTNILKAVAILGVIGIHINANLFNFFHDGTAIKTGLLIFDQFIRFSVPLFVFLSGVSLGSRYLTEKVDYLEYLKRRVFRLLPLYFLWSGIIYFLYRPHVNLWEIIFLGKADYHLYFVPMIFQLYLLFPVFLWIIKKQPVILLVSTFVFQAILLWQFPKQILWTDQQQYIFAGSWVFYFVFGIYLSRKEYVVNKLIWLGLILGAIWTTVDAFHLINEKENILVATRSTKISVYFYSVFFILWSNLLEMVAGKIKNMLSFIGKNSYLIYLSHTVLIRIVFEPFYNKQFDPLSLISTILIFAIVLNLSAKID